MIVFSRDQLDQAMKLGAATLHEAAGRIGALPSAIKPVSPAMQLAGPAFTVLVPAFDNLWIHRALYRAKPGDILVVGTSDGIEAGYWGDVLNAAAEQRGLGGLVIDGGVRDTAGLAQASFPVFSNGVCIRGTVKGFDVPPTIGQPLAIGSVVVHQGDLVVGDRDGVLVVPGAKVDAVIAAGLRRECDEAEKIARIRAGERTLDLYGFGEKDK